MKITDREKNIFWRNYIDLSINGKYDKYIKGSREDFLDKINIILFIKYFIKNLRYISKKHYKRNIFKRKLYNKVIKFISIINQKGN